MMSAELRLERVALLVLMCALVCASLGGCVSAPTLSSFAKAGDSAYKKQQYGEALQIYTNAQDLFDKGLTSDSEFAESRGRYEDTQIIFGTQKAADALEAGDTRAAWIWYSLVSGVDPSDDRCINAAQEKLSIEQERYAELSASMKDAESRGDSLDMAMSAIRRHWLAQDESASDPKSFGSALNPGDESILSGLPSDLCQGAVRPDSLELYSALAAEAPYGIPVYYGEVPVQYEVIDSARVAGAPQQYNAAQRDLYGFGDSLYHLSKQAEKKGADALINVNYKRRGRNLVTEADLVRFLD